MLSQLPTTLCLLLCSAASTAASSLTTFSDANCQTSQSRIAGENGYPDGFCTNIAGTADSTYQSFMFTVLDAGCTRTFFSSSHPVLCASKLQSVLLGTFADEVLRLLTGIFSNGLSEGQHVRYLLWGSRDRICLEMLQHNMDLLLHRRVHPAHLHISLDVDINSFSIVDSRRNL